MLRPLAHAALLCLIACGSGSALARQAGAALMAACCPSQPAPLSFGAVQARALTPRPRCMLWRPLGQCTRLIQTRLMASTAPTAAGSGERQAFAGSSADELAQWLSGGGIPTGSYGQGSAKSVVQLWEEVEAGETQLFIEGGRPLREVSVLNVLLKNSKGQTLYEAEQVLPNGARRRRGLPLSEKLLPGERWQEAVVRGIVEELGPVLPQEPQVEVDEASMEESVETKESQSYPGLLSKYVCKRVSARVLSGLPEEDFCTAEERSDGTLQHCWVWR
ncbi:hypothetical protein ABPG75_007505 [Micractinium tetrahymenae]